jgi:hypothetical protein
MTWRKSALLVVLWAIWLATRAVLYMVAIAPNLNGDIGIYQRWYECCLSHGRLPTADPMWQYPPGAAFAFWLPARLPGSYVDEFVLLMIVCDLAVTLMLLGAARRGGSLAGVWYWTAAVPLLGTTVVTRFDVVPVALSVAALGIAGRPGVRGALIGAGMAVKVWPAVLLAGTATGQRRRAVVAAAVVAAAVCVPFWGAAGSFVTHQGQRGPEIESVAATPFMIWRLAGWHGTVLFQFGAMQLSGGHAALALDASRAGLVLAALAVLAWRLRIDSGRAMWRPEFAADAPLAVTLLFLVVSPVLSPQYMLWAAGLAAVCLATGRTTQWPAALATLAATGLTQLVFPVGWYRLVAGSELFTACLVARNALLVVATVLSWRRILAATAPGDGGQGEVQPDLATVSNLLRLPGTPGQLGDQLIQGFEQRYPVPRADDLHVAPAPMALAIRSCHRSACPISMLPARKIRVCSLGRSGAVTSRICAIVQAAPSCLSAAPRPSQDQGASGSIIATRRLRAR